MSQIHAFRFTPKGGKRRNQQIHDVDLALKHGEDGDYIWIWIDTTKPGDTTDDRGVQGWDSSVLIAVGTDPLPMPSRVGERVEIANVLATEKLRERFLYYWDHADFVTGRMTLVHAGNHWDITFDGTCEAGNRVEFQASLPIPAG